MKRTLAVALVVLAWGCSSGGTPSATPTPSPSPSASPSPSPTPSETPSPTPPPVSSTVSVYFLRGERVQPVGRTVVGSGVARGAVVALLAGPSAAERAAGLTSTVPAGTQLRSLSISDGLATVDLTGTFQSGGGSTSMTLRLAQLVFTLTHFPSVHGVALRLDGVPVSHIGGEGVDAKAPMTRTRFESSSPVILVESPLRSAHVSSPLTVTGTANTFEAVLHLELRHGSTVLVSRTVNATSGSGTRGTFTARLTFGSQVTGAGSLVAYEVSMKDGSRVNVVTIPLVLSAP